VSYHLRCRRCEEVIEPAPAEACGRCAGPTDVAYDWAGLAGRLTSSVVEKRPRTLWRYRELLPTGARVDVGAGWTRLVPCKPLSDLLDLDLWLKLESENPTRSYKDRTATLAVSAALDHGVTTVCCSSTGNLGDAVAAAAAATGVEAVVLVPEGSASAAVEAEHRDVHVLAVRGSYDDCRRLELELGVLFPWGFVSGNLHPYASEGAKTISFEIAEQLDWELPDAVICPAASGTLFAKLAQGFAEVTRAGLAAEPVPRMFAGQALGSSPIADAFADDRRISRVEASTLFASLAVGDPSHGDLALGAARTTGGAIIAVAEDEILKHTALLSESTGVTPDFSGGAALGALVEAIRRGDIAPGSRVVLVVTGARPSVSEGRSRATTVEPDANAVLTALGLHS
jgi:threonine synthase